MVGGRSISPCVLRPPAPPLHPLSPGATPPPPAPRSPPAGPGATACPPPLPAPLPPLPLPPPSAALPPPSLWWPGVWTPDGPPLLPRPAPPWKRSARAAFSCFVFVPMVMERYFFSSQPAEGPVPVDPAGAEGSYPRRLCHVFDAPAWCICTAVPSTRGTSPRGTVPKRQSAPEKRRCGPGWPEPDDPGPGLTSTCGLLGGRVGG